MCCFADALKTKCRAAQSLDNDGTIGKRRLHRESESTARCMLASHCANRATAVKTAGFFITVEQHCPSNVDITFRKDFQCVQHRDESALHINRARTFRACE